MQGMLVFQLRKFLIKSFRVGIHQALSEERSHPSPRQHNWTKLQLINDDVPSGESSIKVSSHCSCDGPRSHLLCCGDLLLHQTRCCSHRRKRVDERTIYCLINTLITALQANFFIAMKQLYGTVTLSGMVTLRREESVWGGLCWKGESGSTFNLKDSLGNTAEGLKNLKVLSWAVRASKACQPVLKSLRHSMRSKNCTSLHLSKILDKPRPPCPVGWQQLSLWHNQHPKCHCPRWWRYP